MKLNRRSQALLAVFFVLLASDRLLAEPASIQLSATVSQTQSHKDSQLGIYNRTNDVAGKYTEVENQADEKHGDDHQQHRRGEAGSDDRQIIAGTRLTTNKHASNKLEDLRPQLITYPLNRRSDNQYYAF